MGSNGLEKPGGFAGYERFCQFSFTQVSLTHRLEPES